jgi:hypothetical protein
MLVINIDKLTFASPITTESFTETPNLENEMTPRIANPIVISRKTMKVCPAGKEINPITGRCVKIKIKKEKKEKISKR